MAYDEVRLYLLTMCRGRQEDLCNTCSRTFLASLHAGSHWLVSQLREREEP